MTIKEFFSFRQNKYFWINILAMIAVVVLLMFGTLKGIDIYTHHGEAVVVPDVKGMTVAEAGAVFDSRGLACIVSDSTYVKDKTAGCILDYNPAAGQKVKEGAYHLSDNQCYQYTFASRSRCGGQQFPASGGSAYPGFGLQVE